MSSQAWFRLTEVQPIVIWGEVLALRYVRQRLSESRLFHLSRCRQARRLVVSPDSREPPWRSRCRRPVQFPRGRPVSGRYLAVVSHWL
jgi:hypothetical protein